MLVAFFGAAAAVIGVGDGGGKGRGARDPPKILGKIFFRQISHIYKIRAFC